MSFRFRMAILVAGMAFGALLPGALCRQADEAMLFGKGDVVGEGWRIESFERQPEFIRLWLSRGERRTGIEITYSRGDSPWSSKHYLVQPAPGEQPSRKLLDAVLERVRQIDRGDHQPLVRCLDKDVEVDGGQAQQQWAAHQPGQAGGGRSWRSWPGWSYCSVFLLVLVFGWLLLFFPGPAAAFTKWSSFCDHNWRWILPLLLVPLALLRLVHLGLPLDADYMTQRLFFGSLDIGDILLHRYNDARHPQLFYLVLHFFLYLGHREWLARLPAMFFSLTAMVSFFFLARRFTGNSGGLLGVLLLGLSFPFLQQSRDISDITLFVTLVLLSCHLLLYSLEKTTLATVLLFAAVEACMFYTYYFAVLVLAAQVIALLRHARSRSFRPLWLGLAGSLLLALPAFGDLLSVIIFDMQTRQLAHQFPHHIWGENTPIRYLQQVFSLLLTGGIPGALLGGVAVFGLVRFAQGQRSRPGFTLVTALLAVGLVVVSLSVLLVRLMPYYLLFLLPLVLILLVLGSLGSGRQVDTSAGRRALSWALAALVVFSYGRQTVAYSHGLYHGTGHDHFRKLGELIRSERMPHTVVIDPDMLHTIVLYYCFPRPLAMYRTCRFEGAPVHCRLDGWRLVALTAMARMKPGWEGEALERLELLGDEHFWFVYDQTFSNKPLLEYLTGHCRQRAAFERLRVFLCPAENNVANHPATP